MEEQCGAANWPKAGCGLLSTVAHGLQRPSPARRDTQTRIGAGHRGRGARVGVAGGGSPVARAPWFQGSDVRQGGRGQSSPVRCGDGEAAESCQRGSIPMITVSSGGRQRRGEVPGDQRGSVHGEARPYWSGEGEQQSSSGGTR
jgi:hypothetical protein